MRNQGFTLIELVITITIILIIAAFAVPGVLNYQTFQNEEQFVNQAISELRNLQLNSITKDDFSNFKISDNSIEICEGKVTTNCKVLTTDNTSEYRMFVPSLNPDTLNTRYFIDRFGNTRKNTDQLIDANEIDLETENFRIIVTKFGGIYKVKK